MLLRPAREPVGLLRIAGLLLPLLLGVHRPRAQLVAGHHRRAQRLVRLVGLLRERSLRERRLLRRLMGSGHQERPFCAVILPFISDFG